MFAALVSVAAAPAAALVAMMALGYANPAAGMAALVLIAGVAFVVASVWARDLDLLAASVRSTGSPDAAPSGQPLLPGVEPLMREVERLSRGLAQRAAQAERQRRADEAVIELLPDPLIVLGADNEVRRANPAARTAFGGDLALVLRHPALRGAIDRALSQNTPQNAELVLPVPVPREVDARVIPMDPPVADGGRALVVLSDRSRERAVERMRADFVANASHELRTPLASLIGFIDTLRGPAADDPPAQQRFLGIMAEQAARMNRLIDDLLSLSRIELMEHQPPSGTVDLGALLPRLAAGFEPRLGARGNTLDLAVAPGLPPLTADADQIAQVVQNLLENAVKYGREGGAVRLSAARADPPAQPGAPLDRRWPARPGVVLSVADQGAGIPRQHLPRLTERFYRVDTGRSRAAGGTGLGLAIVKHVVNRHRGQLLIESEEGVGTTVSVWLPLAV
ncbi:MAG: two-component sensor histidine kinase [Proteobacteria bacterium]|nr:two-component sensor histidine kinase [Pseudomonadota bacterium]